ncbi:MAG: glycogen synthase GlgA [Candidatus Omnitrophica bacterium]|nr:glycogen synthase GlgA [Candidatus Omnitrophota bacterium]
MKIVMIASEVVPFAKTGGLADVVGALPVALEKLGEEAIVIMPGYKCVHTVKNPQVKSFTEGISYSKIGKNVLVYFIENKEYFDRDGLYGDKTGDYKDNLERFSYFCKKALELLKQIKFKPDIIHCHDWQSALIPVYLKNPLAEDPFFVKTRTVFTIHNLGYQGLFPKEELPKTGLDWGVFNMEMLEYYDKINVLKGGLVFSDIITTVSPTYSQEIQTKEFGFGLEGVLAKRKDRLYGILNGLDYTIWDPAKDTKIAANFSTKDISGKAKCKEDLQKICNLPVKKSVPLIGVVSRLAEQKGFDIVAEAIDEICHLDIQMVILGTGDLKYHQIMEQMAKKYPKVISLHLKFDDTLAHKIYAGSDMFLMPSKYEPCGLGQMISFRYGSVPIVFKTGGLADTVNDKNGYIFDVYSKERLLQTLKKAVKDFKLKKKWNQLIQQGMKENFSWATSAKKYQKIYEKAMSL